MKKIKDNAKATRVTKAAMPAFDEYCEMIKPLWETHMITNMGNYHQQLEEKLREYLKVPYISLMVNGHMALEMSIQAMNFPKGSEVITTPYTFVSTTHAIVRNGLKPVFCDIKREDYTIDETKIEELITEKTVAIIPVHVYGNICNVEKIQEIAFKYNLKVIYDAAHAFGECYKGKTIENFGDISILSFHATKVFNTIEGGAVCLHEASLYEKLYNLKNFGIRSQELVVEVGANAKMNEFCAAMGLCNLRHLEKMIEEREKRTHYYNDRLKHIKGIRIRELSEDTDYNFAYYPVLFDTEDGETVRDAVFERLEAANIYARKYFYPITADQACFKNKYKMDALDNARYVSKRILTLPMYPDLEFEKIDEICDILEENLI